MSVNCMLMGREMIINREEYLPHLQSLAILNPQNALIYNKI
jgi:hypothetical protein